MAITLAKQSDNPNPFPFAYLHTRPWKNTVHLAVALDKIFPPDRSDAVYSGLADNDLRVFRYFLRKQANPQERF